MIAAKPLQRQRLGARQTSCRRARTTAVRVKAAAWANPLRDEVREAARHIASPGKGILASDESNATTGKRLAAVGVENTPERRRDWRELLYTTPGLGDHISGAILFDETVFQSTEDGRPFVDVLLEQGIYMGVKVDTGLQILPNTGETATQGLDGLLDRCKTYRAQGARFAKWRAVLTVGPNGESPSEMAVYDNVHALARYAQISQEAGLAPIVEPEVGLTPGTYTAERCAEISVRVYSAVMEALVVYGVDLEGCILKPNMVLPGLDAPRISPEKVAALTVDTLRRTIPAALPTVNFLSGGMAEAEATENLNALQAEAARVGGVPWQLSFSYGRALQHSTLNTWRGAERGSDGWNAAQRMLKSLAAANGQAQQGKFSGPHPSPAGKDRIVQALRVGGSGK
jgi:fructose-bisphosphate aldolase, class I